MGGVLELIFIPGPGIGHIVSAIEVGKLIVNEDSRLSITYLLINDPAVREYTNSRQFHPRLRLLNLPELDEASSDSQTKSKLPEVKSKEKVDRQKPLVREAVAGITATKEARVAGLVVDMFCLTMTDVADEFSIPAYLFFASGAGFLSLMAYMRRLTDEHGADITEFRDSDEKFSVPGFVNPVPATVLPSAMLDKDGGSAAVMSSARQIRKVRGIFINTFQELEPKLFQSFSISNEDDLPPVYAVGPVLNFPTASEWKDSDAVEFLDQQPRKSVVFLCFGSEGRFSDPQIRQLAAALESTGRRFLWSLRRRGENQSGSSTAGVESILPEGFLERTKGVGKVVVGWAPQAAVLAHPAVGGFVSHCGWNSILESVSCGVPMAAWPLYAEQQMNAFQVVEEVGVAVEIAAAIERLMEGEKGVRERAEEMREKSAGAVADGGSSRIFLAKFVRDIRDNSSG
ncbi:anthocyanidin 3-O-glucosyltransferase 2-like isoform X2 [Salvia hispanica]|uniref:anthocyanidin 3-O-glucosyltransferase 2-like isoform X2 n=1 Tax=Salvia hispanica TaxID=49212 RepID=UPI0020091D93|nr:anthocyanidin 3-O-glucosyltransferase 2-like isoform X2 [Salvia hispanica]